ncbi:MAG: universal stress protein [Acidobacteria bacterium]|nr:universal stress protein [Acidobacteriota bacterium]
MKILIAYDGSDFADAAIDDLTRAGLSGEAEAVLMCITDAWELPEIIDRVTTSGGKVSQENAELLRRHVNDALENTRRLAETAAAKVQALFPGWSVRTEVRTGKPAWEIITFADDWQPDLIVVGSHGRGFVGRAILGSVSMKVLHESRTSVRIARERRSAVGDPLHILIAVDGSQNADLCVETVVGRNWPEDTEFRLITADDDPASRPETAVLDLVPEGKEDSEEAKAWVERVLNSPARRMQETKRSISQNCRWGDARRVILDEAIDWKADCIFIGARGLSRFRRLLIGSVSAAVAARAECSVEVVRMVHPEG